VGNGRVKGGEMGKVKGGKRGRERWVKDGKRKGLREGHTVIIGMLHKMTLLFITLHYPI
jgi:hypothetical protein